jgi:hypothetical protein
MNYTVAEIVGSNDWDGGDTPARATTFWTFRQADDQQEYEIGRRPDNPLKVGDSFEAETVGEKFGRIKLKKLQPQRPGSNGWKPDPAKDARITRQHSQDMAIQTLALALQLEVLPTEQVNSTRDLVDAVKTLADAYDRDAYAAGEAAGTPIAPPSTEKW